MAFSKQLVDDIGLFSVIPCIYIINFISHGEIQFIDYFLSCIQNHKYYCVHEKMFE